MGTPYLVLIPPLSHAAQHQDILISQSTLYGPLCRLRDLLRLTTGDTTRPHPFSKRHSALPPSLYTPSLPARSRRFLLNLAHTHLTSSTATFEHDLISRVLDSSRLARLRDLPAYLLASQKLQRCIHKYAVNG